MTENVAVVFISHPALRCANDCAQLLARQRETKRAGPWWRRPRLRGERVLSRRSRSSAQRARDDDRAPCRVVGVPHGVRERAQRWHRASGAGVTGPCAFMSGLYTSAQMILAATTAATKKAALRQKS